MDKPAVTEPPGELMRTTTPFTCSSEASRRIRLAVGPETIEPGAPVSFEIVDDLECGSLGDADEIGDVP